MNWRSVTLGMAGVLFICGLTPYNDYILSNSSLLGTYIPCGMLLFVVAFVALVNLPLARWLPRQALSSAEIAVAVAMALVSCAVPSLGLMGFLPAHLIGLLAFPAADARYDALIEQLDLPAWLLPRVQGSTLLQRATDPVVRGFVGRIPVESDTFAAHLVAIPWSAWIVPAIAWGLLFAMVAGLIVCLCTILRRQWVENERLPFPLATVFLALIEPKPGGTLPGGMLVTSRLFLIAFVAVFAIHLMNGLHTYSPQFPAIPLSGSVYSYLADTPLVHSEIVAAPLRVQFILIGVMYFVQSRMSLSLWAFFMLGQIPLVLYGLRGNALNNAMRTDQQFGSLIVYAVMILWIGRHHFAVVARQMVRPAAADDPIDPYLPYPLAGWGLVACGVGIIVFLCLAGASLAGAIVIVLMMLLLFTVMARIVAETGLPVGEIPVPMRRTWEFLATELPAGIQVRTTVRSFFFTSLFTGLFTWDMREAMPVYGTHALKITDVAVLPETRHGGRQRGRALVAALLAAVLVGYVVSGASMLYCEYTYAGTIDVSQTSPLVGDVIFDKTTNRILDPTLHYLPPGTGPIEHFSRSGHFLFGAAITLVTAVLHLRYMNWPLHPAGFLVANTGPMRLAWFSIFLGWLCKAVIVRFGGSRLFTAAKPVFLGMILGEAGAAAFWLVVGQVLHFTGLPFHAIRIT